MQPEFTAVVTCYFEEKSIDEFHRRISDAFKKLGRPYELVMINDGSTDRTFEKLEEIFKKDPNVSCILEFTKNFGQGAAMAAGIVEATGKHFVFIDSDLQLDPEQLPDLVKEFDKGYDVVSGYRKFRKDPLYRRILSFFASAVLQRVSQSKSRDLGCTFRIIRGNLIRAIGFGPLKTFNQTTVIARSNRHTEIEIRHHSRRFGRSGWTFWKLFDFYMDNLLNVSSRPFQALALVTGTAATLLTLRVFVGIFIDFSLFSKITPGLILHIQVIGTLIVLASIALLGEFTIRSFRSLQAHSLYTIRHVYRKHAYEPAQHTYTQFQTRSVAPAVKHAS